MTEKSKDASRMSKSVQSSMDKLSELHKPKIHIIEAGATHKGIVKQMGGDVVNNFNDISKKE